MVPKLQHLYNLQILSLGQGNAQSRTLNGIGENVAGIESEVKHAHMQLNSEMRNEDSHVLFFVYNKTNIAIVMSTSQLR